MTSKGEFVAGLLISQERQVSFGSPNVRVAAHAFIMKCLAKITIKLVRTSFVTFNKTSQQSNSYFTVLLGECCSSMY